MMMYNADLIIVGISCSYYLLDNLSLENICSPTTLPPHLYSDHIALSIILCPTLLACSSFYQITSMFLSSPSLPLTRLFHLQHHCFSWILLDLSTKCFGNQSLIFSMPLSSLEYLLNSLASTRWNHFFLILKKTLNSILLRFEYCSKECRPSWKGLAATLLSRFS